MYAQFVGKKEIEGYMSFIALDQCDYDMGDYHCRDEAMHMRMLVIMEAMIISMVKRSME